ncbi:MAG TPA: N-acetyltransferase family protein [Usitatibacteraceae bacterium]|nr:N-acetyltransferase family protein [Usitatibacteraceae bacterium]
MNAAIRRAGAGDIPRIAEIYAHHVRSGLASFELEPPDEAEVKARYEAVASRGFPWIVAESGGRVVGYAYASLYRSRPGYRFTLEDSVYVDPDCTGQGIGRQLLERLLAECLVIGCRQVIAVIGDSGNAASIGLHRALGFETAGTLKAVGWKFGRWVDSVLMQRALGPGDAMPPAGG